jgi:hypothetical protein
VLYRVELASVPNGGLDATCEVFAPSMRLRGRAVCEDGCEGERDNRSDLSASLAENARSDNI